MRLFHRTTAAKARAILAEGFRNATDRYMTDRRWTGVWFSNVPLGTQEGAHGNAVLEVTTDLSESDLADYEWVEESKPYREWLVPAALVNAKMSVRLVDEEEAEREKGDPK